MQHLKLTNHELADLEVPLSKVEYQCIIEAVQKYASQLGYPHAIGDEDKEFFETLFAKIHLIKQLNTDNTQQFKEPKKSSHPDVYALEHDRALTKKEPTNG